MKHDKGLQRRDFTSRCAFKPASEPTRNACKYQPKAVITICARSTYLFILAILIPFCTQAGDAYSRPELRSELLQMMAADQKARKEGEANSQDVALLHDRIAVAEGRPQGYATQGRCVEEAGWQPNEIESPKQVDSLREEMGLPPFDSYSERMQQFCQ